MAKVRIVADSTSDIPIDLRKQHNIQIVPLKVHFGTDTYKDSVTIQAEQFYEKLAASSALPTSSQPSPVDFLEIYKRILREDPEADIISVHLSAAMSGTYQSAVLARSLLEEQSERVTVVDSKSASYGIGRLAVGAAEAAEAGKDKEQCLALIEQLRNNTELYILFDTLEYLHKGGRIGKGAALFGSLLNIKPIMTIDKDGEIAPVDKVRGHKKAMARIVDLLEQQFAGQPVEITAAHGNSLPAVQELVNMIQQRFEVKKLMYTNVGPVIGTHAGPGVIAVFVSRA